MARRLRLSNAARDDKNLIWSYTASTYDLEQADAYDKLLVQALRDVRDEPERPSSLKHPEFGPLVRSYRIALSKKRSGTRIRSPRHLIYYTLKYQGIILVLRILKDDMDPRRHLPAEYQ